MGSALGDGPADSPGAREPEGPLLGRGARVGCGVGDGVGEGPGTVGVGASVGVA
jgi:hypothetical protein